MNNAVEFALVFAKAKIESVKIQLACWKKSVLIRSIRVIRVLPPHGKYL